MQAGADDCSNRMRMTPLAPFVSLAADVKVKASTGKMRLQLNEGGAPSVWVLGLLGNDVAVRVKELAKAIKNPDSAASKAPSSQQAAGGMDVMGALRSNSRAAREGKKLAAASKLEDIKKWVLQHDKGVKQSYDAVSASLLCTCPLPRSLLSLPVPSLPT